MIIICGATASGKSALATEIAKKINGEIVSCDSMQIYKYMDIGTAKECDLPVPQHLIDVIEPDVKFSVFDYREHAIPVIKDIISFLNENFTDDVSLDELSDKFFISKYYLCRAFKKSTGLTVQNYIKQKRLMMVKELCSNGIKLTQAASKAGFRDYSSFYRSYKKDNNKSPKDGI